MDFSHPIQEVSHILGQRVQVTDRNGQVWVGELQFVGTNDLFPAWGLHCTVGRTPGIHINSIVDITLWEDRSIFKR